LYPHEETNIALSTGSRQPDLEDNLSGHGIERLFIFVGLGRIEERIEAGQVE